MGRSKAVQKIYTNYFTSLTDLKIVVDSVHDPIQNEVESKSTGNKFGRFQLLKVLKLITIVLAIAYTVFQNKWLSETN